MAPSYSWALEEDINKLRALSAALPYVPWSFNLLPPQLTYSLRMYYYMQEDSSPEGLDELIDVMQRRFLHNSTLVVWIEVFDAITQFGSKCLTLSHNLD